MDSDLKGEMLEEKRLQNDLYGHFLGHAFQLDIDALCDSVLDDLNSDARRDYESMLSRALKKEIVESIKRGDFYRDANIGALARIEERYNERQRKLDLDARTKEAMREADQLAAHPRAGAQGSGNTLGNPFGDEYA